MQKRFLAPMDHIIANIADFRYLCNIMFKKL